MFCPRFLSWRGGVHEAVCLVKDIIHCTTGRHLAFVCISCVSPFRHHTLAMDEWLASVATLSQADQDAHCTGAVLQKSTNKRCYRTHPTGVVLGECNRRFLRARPRRRVTVAGPVYCQSVRHQRGTACLSSLGCAIRRRVTCELLVVLFSL
ncbi:hypothetical protein I4F81_011407 [Pyropia yezoensis]|uniref:Uncharacterized protein n=1 Tax=Pyropia yezoensis TaxID=2788 RepID=A0ACC3CG79_PYRYE|nr:hypothetical protein I4F81_011407 [Neopyropia yezoensis]